MERNMDAQRDQLCMTQLFVGVPPYLGLMSAFLSWRAGSMRSAGSR